MKTIERNPVVPDAVCSRVQDVPMMVDVG